MVVLVPVANVRGKAYRGGGRRCILQRDSVERPWWPITRSACVGRRSPYFSLVLLKSLKHLSLVCVFWCCDGLHVCPCGVRDKTIMHPFLHRPPPLQPLAHLPPPPLKRTYLTINVTRCSRRPLLLLLLLLSAGNIPRELGGLRLLEQLYLNHNKLSGMCGLMRRIYDRKSARLSCHAM